MRSAWIAIILLAAVLPATARAAEEPLLTDPEGDAQWTPAALGMRLPGAPTGPVEFVQGNDLTALHVAESEDALAITVSVMNMQGEPQGTATLTELAFRDREYRLWMGYFTGSISTSAGGSSAYLQAREGDGWDFVARLDLPAVDRDAGTISASVPKAYLMDGKHAIPERGDIIEVLRVVADANFVGTGIVDARVYDEMEGGVALTMAHGDVSNGDLEMGAQDRVRVSNGGATTFVYQATLRNHGDAAHELRLAAEDMPEGWDARVQPSTLTVPAGEARTASVLVSVPFAHEHGGYSSLNLTAQSARDAATNGRMRLGVLHTPIPQPAGHHSELFLHAQTAFGGPLGAPFETATPYAWGWMNTDADHADDHAYVTPSSSNGETTWWIPLNPRLLTGLDFDLDRTGLLEAEIVGGSGEVEATAQLYYWRDTAGGGESVLVAEGAPTLVALDHQQTAPLSIQLTPTAESDYMPYAPDTYLTLALHLDMTVGGFTSSPLRPRLVTESFKLSLPLNEYHDRLTGAAEVASSIEVVAKGAVEKTGHGGSVLTYAFDVAGAPGETIVVDLAGSDADLARAVPGGEVALGEGPTEVLVAVEIPASANPGEELEVLLFIHARDDPTQMAIARTMTRVAATGDEAAPDETAALLAAEERNEKTPMPVGAALVALAGVALALRR